MWHIYKRAWKLEGRDAYVWWIIDRTFDDHLASCTSNTCVQCDKAMYPTATAGSYERDYLHSQTEAELICDHLNIRDYGRVADG